MQKTFDILLGNQKIGKAEVKKEGLYYQFKCRCHLSQSDICTITVSGNGTKRKLGVCVPMDGMFGLDTKIPVKHIGEEPFVFSAAIKSSETQEQFYPIESDKAFPHLELLASAFLCTKNNQQGIRINIMQTKAPNQPDNDQNRKYPNK